MRGAQGPGAARAIRRWIWLALASALTITACDASPRTPDAPAATSTCPATAELGGSAPLDRQGAGDGATLWALFFPAEPVLTAGKEIKVAWRMTGSGTFSISARGPGGAVVRPVWGPEVHGGSSWNRPGEEWGTGWSFPTAGCWTIHAQRTKGSGYLVLRVADRV